MLEGKHSHLVLLPLQHLKVKNKSYHELRGSSFFESSNTAVSFHFRSCTIHLTIAHTDKLMLKVPTFEIARVFQNSHIGL